MSLSFNEFNLSEDILYTVSKLGFKNPTEVQKCTIPKIIAKEDVIVKSQTGSGKTASFAIPICEVLDWQDNKPQALVLVPTRELALQVKDEIFNIGRQKRVKVVPVFGKTSMKNQIRDLKQKCHIVVGTPGRVIDHINGGNLDLSNVKYFVLDEADEMLNMGFVSQIEEVIEKLPKNIVTALFSATMPQKIEELAQNYMNNPQVIDIESENSLENRIIEEKYFVEEDEKFDLLCDVTTLENPDSCIIFCNTKQQVDDVDHFLYRNSYKCDKLHGGMEQSDRTAVMKEFKHGDFRYLIATDVAGRGIDVDDISLVINFDVPKEKEAYVHRIGRTARKDKKGKAISFVGGNEEYKFNEIEEFLGRNIIEKSFPDKELIEQNRNAFEKKMDTKIIKKFSKAKAVNQGILKLHINAGKKQKMRPVDIVGTLCSIDGISAEDIGIISVIDISTFFEILNGKGEMVLKILQNMPIKGRLRKVNIARS